MTNNNFNNFLGYFLLRTVPLLSQEPSVEWILSYSGILKYDGTRHTSTTTSDTFPLSNYFYPRKVFGEAQDNNLSNTLGIFLTLGTDDTPPTRSDLKLGNSVEDFVCLSCDSSAGITTSSNDFLIFNSVVVYKGSSPIIIKEMGLNCVIYGQKFLLARETIEPLVINPDDTYSFVMRIK